MPVKLGCPGAPKCLHVFTFVPAWKAHIVTCKHAQDKNTCSKWMETTMPEHFDENKRGNITIARNGDNRLK